MRNKKSENRPKLTNAKKFKKQLQQCEKIDETVSANQKCSKDVKTRKKILVAIRHDLLKKLFVIREQVQKKNETLDRFWLIHN